MFYKKREEMDQNEIILSEEDPLSLKTTLCNGPLPSIPSPTDPPIHINEILCTFTKCEKHFSQQREHPNPRFLFLEALVRAPNHHCWEAQEALAGLLESCGDTEVIHLRDGRKETITRHGGGGACDAVVFAEMFLQGYGMGYDVAALAEAPNGPSFVTIAKMASTANLHVIYSYAEKAPDGRLYISVQCVDPTGASLANVRKTHLFTPSAFESQNFTPGDALSPVFLLCGVATALLICFDVECVDAPRALARRGAEFLLVVGANDSVFVMNAMLATRAMENLCHVMYVNQMERGRFCGLSAAYGPDGECIAQLGENGVAGCVMVTVNPKEEKYIAFRAQNPYWDVVTRRPHLYEEEGVSST